MKPLAGLAPHWPAIERTLDEALDQPAAERLAWLERQTTLSPPVLQAVRDLLARHAGVETGDFMGTLPPLKAARPAAADGPAPGDSVGPWVLLRELGRGGMGSVWLAERADGALKRRVALKLPHLSWVRGLAERMARERDILATLEHPHIARLYDAGVDTLGRPWLALEYVPGQPIDVHCRAAALPVAARVQLLLQACSAVAYAHGRLVIHRDLKPGNILVGEDGGVRLLDFGIAKLLDDGSAGETALTRAAGRALTLDYASPEQVRGEPLTTASDVYSLGVVAYELLTGARPYRLKRGSAAELEQAIEQAEIEPASRAAADPQAREALRGELDAVLHKALQKEPAQRYAGVDAFAEDLQAALEGRAVRARPDTALQRLARALRRHRLAVLAGLAIAAGFALAIGVGATTLVITALSAGLGVAWWQATQARQGRREAEAATARATAAAEAATREAMRAGAIGEFMVRVFSSTTDKQADPEAARRRTAAELLTQGVAEIETLRHAHPQAHAQLLRTFGELHLELQLHDTARGLFERALEGARGAFGEDHVETQLARIRLAGFLIGTARGAEGRALVEQAVETLRRTAPRTEAMAEALSELCSQLQQRDPPRAIAAGREAVALMDQLTHGRRGYREVLARQRLCRAHRYDDDVEAAGRLLDEVAASYEALFGPDSMPVAEALRERAHLHYVAGDYEQAMAGWHEVVARFETRSEASMDSRCETQRALAVTHLALGDPATSMACLEGLLALLDSGAAPRLGQGQRWITRAEQAHVLLAQGRLDEAWALARAVRAEVTADLAAVRVHLLRVELEVLQLRGRSAEAVAVEEELLALLQARRGTGFQRQAVLAQLAASAAARGEVALAQERLAQSDAVLSARAPARRRAFVTALAHARVATALGAARDAAASPGELQRLADAWLPALAPLPPVQPRLLQCELVLHLAAAAPGHAAAAPALAAAHRHLAATQVAGAPLLRRAQALLADATAP